jgi:hypothetical protein
MSEPPLASFWAAPPEFYIDENMAGRTIVRFLRDLGYFVHTPTSVFGRERLDQGLDDDDWLPVIGSKGWVVFCRDQRILERPLELQAYLAAKVHMFLLPGNADRALILSLVSVNLREICALAVARRSNVYWLTPTNVIDYERRKAATVSRRKLQ